MFNATFYIKKEVIFQCLLSGWSPLLIMPFQDPTYNLQDFKQNWNPMSDPRSSIFVVQKAAAPKSGVEFHQGSIGTISGSLATSYDVWRRRARKKYDGVGWVGGWLAGWFLVHFIATSWSNLQACKISSRAEIPKLDRVWQKQKFNSGWFGK